MNGADRSAARAFLARTGADAIPDPLERLSAITRSFSVLPYENLTKILRRARGGSDPRRLPAEVLADHDRLGAGGTCFSLSWFLAAILAEAGFESRYRLADRSYADASHTALEVVVDGRGWLVDPGYLLDRPIPLDERRPVEIRLPAEGLLLEPDAAGGTWSLFTVSGTHRKFRYRLQARPAAEGDFVDRWLESFDWPMMDSLVLSRVNPAGRHYLRDVHYHFVGRQGRRQGALEPTEGDLLRDAFGIDPALFEEARDALARRP